MLSYIRLLFMFLCATSLFPAQERNLIVLLDTGREHVSSKNKFVLSVLLSGLQQSSSALLVSKHVWQNYVMRYTEYALQAEMPNSPEAHLHNHYRMMIDRLSYWSQYYKGLTPNSAEIRSAAIEHVRDELYSKSAVADRKARSIQIDQSFEPVFNFTLFVNGFDRDAWQVYEVDDYFYLLVPKIYKDQCAGAGDPLGFRIEHLNLVDDPISMNTVNFIRQDFTDFDLVASCKKVCSRAAILEWNIILFGHGMNREFDGGQRVSTIASMSRASFNAFLSYLSESLSTKMLLYQTCYGSGQHLSDAYSNKKFDFPIVSLNLTDVVTLRRLKRPGEVNLLSHEDLDAFEYVESMGTWRYRSNFSPNWDTFFDQVRQMGVCLETFKDLTGYYVENTPQIRYAGAEHFECLYPRSMIEINERTIVSKHVSESPVVATHGTEYILLSQEVVDVPLHILHEKYAPRIISTVPGKADHFFAEVVMPYLIPAQVVDLFWPIESQEHTKVYAINKFMCKNVPGDPFAQMIQVESPQMVLHNVIIISKYDAWLQIFGRTGAGVAFTAFARKVVGQKNPVIRACSLLDADGIKNYDQLFGALRENAARVKYTESHFYKKLSVAQSA